MNKRSVERGEQGRPVGLREAEKLAFESGVMRVLDERPPWGVVREYLSSGAHRGWVEGHAARSPGFAYLLELQRSARAEREGPAAGAPSERMGVVLPFTPAPR